MSIITSNLVSFRVIDFGSIVSMSHLSSTLKENRPMNHLIFFLFFAGKLVSMNVKCESIVHKLFYSTTLLLSIVSPYQQKADWKNLQQKIFVEAFWCISSINLLFVYAQLSALSVFINRFVEKIDPKASTKKFC